MNPGLAVQMGVGMGMGVVIPLRLTVDPAAWAQVQWGTCKLGDRRRTARAVTIGQKMAEHPGWSLPAQQGDWAATLGAYRLLNHPDVELAALLEPHLKATRKAAGRVGVTLFPQDGSTLDYSAHPHTRDLGPVGSRRQRGHLLHSTLAVAAETGEVLGLADVRVIRRPEGPPPKKTHAQRAPGPEGQAWEQAVEAIGEVPAGATWLYVSDRESDIYDYLAACRKQHAGYVVRACRNRRVHWGPGGREHGKLLDHVRSLAPQSGPRHTTTVAVPATAKSPAREATLVLSWGRVLIPPSSCANGDRHATPLETWAVRAWEANPPAGVKRVEWILLTSEPVLTATQAAEVVAWYSRRWLVEDYHMCLKTGCRVEHSQLDSGDDLKRLLGFHAPLAVRLLQLRQLVRISPDQPAVAAVEPLLVKLLAAKLQRPTSMTLQQFWQGVAQLGGHLGRKRDGAPGWRTLWRGWLTLQDYAVGARLFANAPPDQPAPDPGRCV